MILKLLKTLKITFLLLLSISYILNLYLFCITLYNNLFLKMAVEPLVFIGSLAFIFIGALQLYKICANKIDDMHKYKRTW